MTKEEFKELAEKHLFILEGYTMDEEGNKEMQIFGFDKLYEALNMRIVSREFKVKHTPTFEEFMINFCKHGITLTNNYTKETIGLKELIHKWKITNDIKP